MKEIYGDRKLISTYKGYACQVFSNDKGTLNVAFDGDKITENSNCYNNDEYVCKLRELNSVSEYLLCDQSGSEKLMSNRLNGVC
jgi:hypothetical protein